MAATLDGSSLSFTGNTASFKGMKFRPLTFFPSSYTWTESAVSGLRYVHKNIELLDNNFADCQRVVSAMIYDWGGLTPGDFTVAGGEGHDLTFTTKTSGWTNAQFIKLMVVYI